MVVVIEARARWAARAIRVLHERRLADDRRRSSGLRTRMERPRTLRREYLAMGGLPSNVRNGWVYR